MLKAAELYTHTHTHTHTHTQLRRCIAFLLFIIVPCSTFAVDACVPNDVVAVVLDSTVVPGSSVRIISACLSSNFGLAQLGLYKQNNGILIDNGAVVVGGERNVSEDGYSICWCKIVYPVVSYWFLRDWNYTYSLSYCSSNCASGCDWIVQNYGDLLRKHIYNSIEN